MCVWVWFIKDSIEQLFYFKEWTCEQILKAGKKENISKEKGTVDKACACVAG